MTVALLDGGPCEGVIDTRGIETFDGRCWTSESSTSTAPGMVRPDPECPRHPRVRASRRRRVRFSWVQDPFRVRLRFGAVAQLGERPAAPRSPEWTLALREVAGSRPAGRKGRRGSPGRRRPAT